MTVTRAFVRTILGICVAAPLAAQQPGSVTAVTTPKPALGAAMTPIGIPIDRIVAIVGQKPILWSEVMDAIFYLQGAGEKVPQDSAGLMNYARDTILNQMIDQEVLINVAKQFKTEIDDKDIAPDVDKRLKELHGRFKSDAEFRAQLKAEGFGTETELRTSLLDRRRRDMLQVAANDSLRAHGKLAAPVNVTEVEVTAAYQKAKDKIGRRPATAQFRQVIVAPKANTAERLKAKAKADSLLAVVQKGGDFEAIAKKESMDPGSKDAGGALPFVRRGQMVEAFDRAIFSGAPPGTIIPIVIETSIGFHIIRIDRVQPAQVKSSHILIIPHLDSTDVARAKLTADTVITKWRSGTPYDSLVKYYHDPAELKGVPEPYPIDSLPEEYRNGIADVKKGQLSQPFQIPNPQTGFPKWVVVLMTERADAGELSLADVRDKIRQQLLEERATRRMLDQLRKEQFVKIMM